MHGLRNQEIFYTIPLRIEHKWRRYINDGMTILKGLNSEDISGQRYLMNMPPAFSAYGNVGIPNTACMGRDGHVHRQARGSVVIHLAEAAVRLCSQTCCYIIKEWKCRLQRLADDNYAEFLQNEMPAFLENVCLRKRLQIWYQHDGSQKHISLWTSRGIPLSNSLTELWAVLERRISHLCRRISVR